LPDAEYQESIGVDFGDKDPMTAVHVKVDHKNRKVYWKQLFYASEAPLEDLAKEVKRQVPNWGEVLMWCDHDPKLIRMLRDLDLPAYKANKKNGLSADIRLIKQYELFIHEDSEMLIYEMDNYKFQKKGDLFIDYPDQSCEEHAIDAGRYGTTKCVN
jgi:phage terminase large subunit